MESLLRRSLSSLGCSPSRYRRLPSPALAKADTLRFDGHRLSAGYRVFRTILTPQGWKSFGCGGGVRGLMLTGRSRSLTFVLWNGRSASASISLPSQTPVFGVCGSLSRPPPPVK